MKFIYDDGGRSKYYKAKGVGDCAVRAIAIATGLDYKQVYDDLTKLQGRTCRNGTSVKAVIKYMNMLNWYWKGINKRNHETCHLQSEDLPNGTLIVQVSKHLTCVKDKVLHDIYDCSRNGNRGVYGYWYHPSEAKIVLGE